LPRLPVGQSGFNFELGLRFLSSLQQSDWLWDLLASYPKVTGDSFPEVKWLGHEADQSPLANVKINDLWSYTFTLPYFFMVWCLFKGRDTIICVTLTTGIKVQVLETYGRVNCDERCNHTSMLPVELELLVKTFTSLNTVHTLHHMATAV